MMFRAAPLRAKLGRYGLLAAAALLVSVLCAASTSANVQISNQKFYVDGYVFYHFLQYLTRLGFVEA
jgi:hypothetical protein